ncbi:MAG: hypothetical protein Q8K67_14325 [Geothrix sp.]|nr:hypothetical protein [Geothrix sp.]
MKVMRRLVPLLLLPVGLGVQAQTESQGVVGVRGALLSYSDEAVRERLASGGFFLDLDDRESGGFRLALGRDAIRYRDASTMDQDTALVGGRLYIPLGAGQGKLVIQGDLGRVTFQEQGLAKQTATISGAHLGYLSDIHPEFARLWLDLGFIQSRYDGGLRAEQWSPTLGFGVNDNMDWFTLGADAITLKGTGGPEEQTTAFKASWTHYFVPGAGMKPRSIYLSGLAGERIYAADTDLAIIYTLGDYQTGRWAFGATWGGAKGAGFSLEAGSSRFEDRTTTPVTSYTTPFVAASIHYTW